jgi:hypothetical protein
LIRVLQFLLVLSALNGVPAQTSAARPAAGLHGAITTQNGAVYLPGVVITVADAATRR